MKFNRHEWSKRWRANQKALAKAIRQKRKRSHLRIQAIHLDTEKTNKLYGGLSGLMGHRFNKRHKELASSVSDRNPLLEMLKKHGVTPESSQNLGGKIFLKPIKYSESNQ